MNHFYVHSILKEVEFLMDDKDRLEKIKSNKNPSLDTLQSDVLFLLRRLENKEKETEKLEKKNRILSQHSMELTQEMENIKSDFGGDIR